MLSFFQSDVRLSRPADAGVSHFRHWRDPMTIDVRGLAPLLNVFDMPTSIKFYCDGLGFEIALNDGKPAPHFDWVLLRLNESELMLNTAYEQDQRPPAPDPKTIAAHQDTAIYFGCPDVDGVYRSEERRV